MSAELTAYAGGLFTKSSIVRNLETGPISINVSGADAELKTQLVTTSEAALAIPAAIGTIGWILIINRDPTNYVSLRRATGEGNFMKLLHGEFAFFRCEATAPFIIANTASCQVEYLIIEA